MKILVGYTGFVGSNILKKHQFDQCFNSKNIEDAFGLEPDLCVYAGIPAEKYIANKFPEKDFQIISNAIENIKKINPKRIVLISTIDVLDDCNNKDEDYSINEERLEPYGFNRRYLEKWVLSTFEKSHVIRLPGLFGLNIKKNFIYDCISYFPKLLNEKKYAELVSKEAIIAEYYRLQDTGFYQLKTLNVDDECVLRSSFEKLKFSALNFTDSRGTFQFYNLDYCWYHIEKMIRNNIPILHCAVEPCTISEIYFSIFDEEFVNEITDKIPYYDFKTKYDNLFDGENGYLFNKQQVISDIVRFVKG